MRGFNRIMNTPFCVALVNLPKNEYYNVFFERFQDVKNVTRISAAAADSINTLVTREENIRVCDVLLNPGDSVFIATASAEGANIEEVVDLGRSIYRKQINGDAFRAIQTTLNEIWEHPYTDGGRSRSVTLAATRLDIPGPGPCCGDGWGLPFFSPIVLLRTYDILIELVIAANANLGGLIFDAQTHERLNLYSSAPQYGMAAGCDYAVAKCDDAGAPLAWIRGADQFHQVTIPSVQNPSTISRIPAAGVASPEQA